ncbi:alpha/beta fold hydrolase [Sphingomonas nostoxanthinifaciens]|uniref:alpha/beta fold hydrolase n=1 Tax=Sphingomonas nostoxanthinifaciens TaxID=2872652 RepID=UPI001CC1D4B3|nr:alpha/beta fold hydrolase [Sphingomonas nostoxanthinifaciens]UAK23463.1 alpha/beta fold hydrolase [Sphingomonas nostoxanthinifaciens]
MSLSLIVAALALQAGAPTAPIASPAAAAPATPKWPIVDADFVVRDYRFRSGETLPQVRIHYATLGQPHRNAAGEIDNAVMVLHGTGGSGRQFLAPQFADELYGPGQPLDIRKYWIILPDNVGHGHSSKPSDGLHMRFPKYDYDDMVILQHRLLTEGLGIKHARLIMGTSMGCMHGFIWGEMYPDYARAIMPMACEPVPIAGLNRMWRQLLIDGIEADPAWMGGEYKVQPAMGLRVGSSISVVAGAAPLNYQKLYPTREAATAAARERVAKDMATRDANDMIYQFDSSRTYDPWPGLEKITTPFMWLNSADDFINPRNFTYPQEALKRMGPKARFRLIPESDETHGHGTHTWAVNWKTDLVELLARSGG